MKRLFFTFFAVMAMLFTAHAQTPAGYAIFGDKPYGYEDLRDQVEVSTSINSSGNQISASNYSDELSVIEFSGKGLGSSYVCGNNVAVSIRFKNNQTLSLTDHQAIHIKIRRTDENTSGGLELCMMLGYWGGGGTGDRGRFAFEIANTSVSQEISELILNYDETSSRNTYSTFNKPSFTGNSVLFTGVSTLAQSELFRINAASGESFEITQIYIDADANAPDPVDPNECTDEDDPTGLTLAASNIQDKSVTLTASANDAASSISYDFFYKAESDAEFTSAGTASAAPNTDATKEVKGLAPETNYTFKVVATDPCNNEAEFVKPEEVRTLAFVERRYYFFRGDPATVSLPSDGVISYDLREGVGTTIERGGFESKIQKKYYTNFENTNAYWSFNQNLSSAKDMSEISQAEWYLVVKFRTNISYGNFNIRLNNAVSYQNGQNLSYESDGLWNVLTLALADAKNTLSYSASQSGTVFQFHADGGNGYLDIAYAYLTNNAASVDDLADNVAPAISSVVDGDKTTSSVVLTVTASDDSGEDITYIVKEGATVLTSTPATGASGAATAITVSELVGQNHTLTVIARDGAGNETSQNIVVELLESDTPPHDLVVSTTHDDRSVMFTMTAEDNNAALSYAILDGEDNVLAENIAGTSGVATIYKLSGLDHETSYTFKVRVSDNSSLSITSDEINVTTDAFVAHRFYLLRGDNSDPLPASSNLTSTYVDCDVNVAGNGAKDTRVSKYLSIRSKADSYMAITFNPKAPVANEIDDDWYIVVRMRANLSHDVFGYNNFRLNLSNNAQNWYINNSDSDKPFGRDYNDGNWIVIKKRIGDRRAGTAIPASYLQAGQIAAQLHVASNLLPGEFLDIDYIYFTDDITSVDEGTQSLRRVVLKDNADNSAVLSAHNGETVDADLVRTLSSASYNSFCLPFDMSAAQVEETFGAGAKIGRLNNAAIEGDELLLGFGFVNSIEAGVPYLIQPEGAVANPFVENVTLANTEKPAVFNDVRFIGVLNPTKIQQESQENHFVLLLGPDNELTWANTTANMKGMRAYFKTGSTVSKVVRRARFNFEGEQVATGLDEVQRDNVQCTKVIRDGQLYILHNGAMYNVQGVRVQ